VLEYLSVWTSGEPVDIHGFQAIRNSPWTTARAHDKLCSVSYDSKRKRAITVRVPEARLKQVMRARRIATQSELINTLLEEAAEKIASRRALEAAAGTLGPDEFDDRLL
jgi:hypothetical protein